MSRDTIFKLDILDSFQDTFFGVIIGAFARIYPDFKEFIVVDEDREFVSEAWIYWKTQQLDILKYKTKSLYIVRIKNNPYRKI
jgi:hypothetical protein